MPSRTLRILLIVSFIFLLIAIAQAQVNEDHHELEEGLHDDHVDEDHDDHDDDHDHDEHGHDEKADAATVWKAIGITTFAGCAAFLGFFSIFVFKKEGLGIHIMSYALAFSSGVIVYLCFMNLIPECVEQLESATDHDTAMAQFLTLLCVIGGIAFALGMEALFRHFSVEHHHHHHPERDNKDSVHQHAAVPTTIPTAVALSERMKSASDGVEDSDNPETKPVIANGDENDDEDGTGTRDDDEDGTRTREDMDDEDEIESEKRDESQAMLLSDEDRPEMSRVSYSVAIALILHHFPEGIATFVSLYHDLEFGVLVAFALALHDIPSGICISVPLYIATGSKMKPFILCAVAAAVYPLGAFIGWIVIETASDTFVDRFIGCLFGVTGGIMLYIAFVELLPAAIVNANRLHAERKDTERKDMKKRNAMNISIGMFFCGLLIMNISQIVLSAVGGHEH